jgi:hypothetical protein
MAHRMPMSPLCAPPPRLVAQRFLLPEDARRLVDEAQARRILAGRVAP